MVCCTVPLDTQKFRWAGDMSYWIVPLIGFISGTFSGMFGIGGGVILIPILVYICGLSQHDAQGTTLAAMVPPIGLLAAFKYWQAGHVDIPLAMLISVGFILGGYFGASIIQDVPELTLKRFFGACLLLVALKFIAGK
jgi:uncharacterized membrane protein YfcA